MIRRSLVLVNNIALLAALLVAITVATQGPAEVTARVEPTNCLDGIYRVPAQRANLALSSTVTIRPACGGGFGGGLGGRGIGGPMKGAGWTKNSSYGARGYYTKAVKSKPSMRKWEKRARKHKVPVPNPNAKRAKDMSSHGVYQLFRASDKKPYKYGITKSGKTRPKRQLAKCRKVMKGDCRWEWVRTDVNGWLKARRIEMIYATRYRTVTGKCPPGMPRCL